MELTKLIETLESCTSFMYETLEYLYAEKFKGNEDSILIKLVDKKLSDDLETIETLYDLQYIRREENEVTD